MVLGQMGTCEYYSVLRLSGILQHNIAYSSVDKQRVMAVPSWGERVLRTIICPDAVRSCCAYCTAFQPSPLS